MSSLMDDLAAASSLVDAAVQELRNLDPNHELLQYVNLSPEEEREGEIDRERAIGRDQAMLARFCQIAPEPKRSWDGQLELFEIGNGTLRWVDGLSAYWKALQSAAKGFKRSRAQPVLR